MSRLENKLRALITKWRKSASNSEDYLDGTDSVRNIENQTHMLDMYICADELEAAFATTCKKCGKPFVLRLIHDRCIGFERQPKKTRKA